MITGNIRVVLATDLAKPCDNMIGNVSIKAEAHGTNSL